MSCAEVERLVDAYNDDELDAAEAVDVTAHLSTCPACHQCVATRTDLRRLIRGVPYYVAPERLRRAIATTRRPRRVTTQWLALAATALLAVSLGANSIVQMVRARQAAAATAGTLTDARSLRGFQVRHWTDEAMAFWAVSDLNDLELDQFVHTLHP